MIGTENGGRSSSVPDLVQLDVESIVALANSYYNTSQSEKAGQTLRALLNHPAEFEGVFMGGQVAASAKDYDTAEKLFMSIKTTYPDRALLGYNIALVQYRANRFNESQKTLLDLISTGYETSALYNLLGWCYEKQHELRRAAGAFVQAIDRDPSREANYLDLGTILMDNKQFEMAYAVAKRAAEVLPNSYRVYKNKGLAELKIRLFTGAVKSYSRASKLNPADSGASLGLAMAQSGAGMIREAQATYEKGIKQFPGDAQYYLQYARMLSWRAESGEVVAESRVAVLLKTALSLDNSLSEAHYELGKLALRNGDNKQALEHLKIASKLDPESTGIHYTLARTYGGLGEREEAEKEFQIFQRLKGEEDKAGSVP
jgi:tetratricopeptide (TPR) repeat protein